MPDGEGVQRDEAEFQGETSRRAPSRCFEQRAVARGRGRDGFRLLFKMGGNAASPWADGNNLVEGAAAGTVPSGPRHEWPHASVEGLPEEEGELGVRASVLPAGGTGVGEHREGSGLLAERA